MTCNKVKLQEIAIEKLTEALHACQDAKFSRNVVETVCLAIDNAYDEVGLVDD